MRSLSWRVLGAIALSLSLFQCVPTGFIRYQMPEPFVENNTLGAGDVFGVRVYGEADMSQDYRVNADGTIGFPYLGRLKVEGMNVAQIEDMLTEQLKAHDVLKNPSVSIIVREVNSRQFVITGQVARAGTYPHRRNMTIVDAVATAGGFTGIADQTVLLTRRETDGKARTYRIPVDAINEGRAPNLDIAPGDIILVRQNPI